MVAPLDYNPAGWWRAADSGAQGNTFVATDLSGNGRHATQTTLAAHPTKVYRPTGIYDWAWSFDGIDDFLTCPAGTEARQSAQTVVALAKLTGVSTTKRVWGFSAYYSLFANASQWGYYATSGDAIKNLGGNTSAWTVIAVRQHDGTLPSRELVGAPKWNGLTTLVGALVRRPNDENGYSVWSSQQIHLLYGHRARVHFDQGMQDWLYTITNSSGETIAEYQATSGVLGTYSKLSGDGWDASFVLGNAEAAGAYSMVIDPGVTASWTPKWIMPTTNCLAIGAESTLGGQRFQGLIADVQLYNELLSNNDIVALYEDYFVPRYFVEPIGGGHGAGRLGICGLMI